MDAAHTPRWRTGSIDPLAVDRLSREAGLRSLTARILTARGISDAGAAERFLSPRLADLRPPDGMADLDRVLERLARAAVAGEKVAVFGDYDVDGVTAAASLAESLRALGAEVVVRCATRAAGYGLPPEVAAGFADEGCHVLVACDCGTNDHESLRLLRARGVDAIVIDHHQVPAGETAAFALVNPHRPDDRFPWKGLASCGVAFYIAAALRTRLRGAGHAAAERFDPRGVLDLVALGSIGDVVPLREENRALVAAGLRELAARRRPGLRALARVAGLDVPAPSALDVSFKLIPRLNAAGRLGDAQRALELLLAVDEGEAERRAQDLDEVNRERRRIQADVLAQAQAAAAAERHLPAIVLGGDEWHHGVVGIVAARLVDDHRRPVVVVGFQDGVGRGSARTTPGFDLYQALRACAPHLQAHGGHAAAAGLTVRREDFSAFRTAFLEIAAQRLGTPGAETVEVDAVAALGDLDLGQVEELERLAPFGAGNAQPVLALPGVVSRATRVVGERHLHLTLAGGGVEMQAIAFGMADRDPGEGARLDVIAQPEIDVFRGARRSRLRIKQLLRSDAP